MGGHLAQTLEAVDFHLGVGIVAPELGGNGVPLLVGIGHPDRLSPRQLKEGRDGAVDVAVFNQRTHIAEKEGQEQGPDVGPVHVGVSHDNDLMIT